VRNKCQRLYLLRSKVNCCVKKKALTMYIDAFYRGVGQNYSTPEKYRKPLVRYQSDNGETKRQARQDETSKTKTNQGKGTRKKSTEPKTKDKQDNKRARNSLIPNPRTITNMYQDPDYSINYQNHIECRTR
jgi:hypothetical protein